MNLVNLNSEGIWLGRLEKQGVGPIIVTLRGPSL